MERCATCRHWQPPSDDDIRGTCEAIWDSWWGQDRDAGLALINRGDDCGATLFTAPDFGCVLWEVKER